MLRTIIEDFERKEHLKRGYDIVMGPQILKTELWQTSGHYENYRENMYTSEVDEIEYAIKPMNCPGGMLLHKTKAYSYRDLPLRAGEIGQLSFAAVFKYEQLGGRLQRIPGKDDGLRAGIEGRDGAISG